MPKTKMTIFIIDDDPGDITLLRRKLEEIETWEVELLTFSDTEAAQRELRHREPDVVFLDYMLGAQTGLDILRKLQESHSCCPIIMLTGKGNEEVAVEAMRLGAADYLVKDSVLTGNLERAILNAVQKHKLQQQIEKQRQELVQKVHDLEEALAHVKQLQGLLPICMYCKKIRTDRDTWQQIEEYIVEHSDAMFSHSICQECMEKNHPGIVKKSELATIDRAE